MRQWALKRPSKQNKKTAIGYVRPLNVLLGYTAAYTCPCSLSLPLVSLWNVARWMWGLIRWDACLAMTQILQRRRGLLGRTMTSACGRHLSKKTWPWPEKNIGFHSHMSSMAHVWDSKTCMMYHHDCTGMCNSGRFTLVLVSGGIYNNHKKL